ncbi:unnamed protein product [marine sediment metagenome]|uniref:Uncharacterized protein n=1 Tax=marine sediment metagenome TaxID=412755 RepID=X1KPR6_9ZZZZ
MEFEKKTSKCPVCGGKSLLTTWLPPTGINQQFREYRCDNIACRNVFYTCGIFHIDNKKL